MHFKKNVLSKCYISCEKLCSNYGKSLFFSQDDYFLLFHSNLWCKNIVWMMGRLSGSFLL